MKKILYIAFLSSLLLLSSCSFEQNSNTYESNEQNSNTYESNFNSGYENGYVDGYEDATIKFSEYSENINDYYERLCDQYGFLTYEMVSFPERWRYYVCPDIYHVDWLCSNFNHDTLSVCTANPELLDVPICPYCKNIENDFYFLDVESEIFHSQKSCLNLGTSDYISPKKNYRFVGYNSAISSGYTYCEICSAYK